MASWLEELANRQVNDPKRNPVIAFMLFCLFVSVVGVYLIPMLMTNHSARKLAEKVEIAQLTHYVKHSCFASLKELQSSGELDETAKVIELTVKEPDGLEYLAQQMVVDDLKVIMWIPIGGQSYVGSVETVYGSESISGDASEFSGPGIFDADHAPGGGDGYNAVRKPR
ncbi:MAG: hypothetical protein R3B38_02560 [Patescibacteria group bacterium]